jgi:FAD/FMN-containing dehydrogenase
MNFAQIMIETFIKINEDVVIPLPRMGDYCDGIERINIELSMRNKLRMCESFLQHFIMI